MINSFDFEKVSEQEPSLRDILTQHTIDYMRTGVYKTWIDVVSRYCTDPNSPLQSELNDFGRIELPLAAITLHNQDRIYPGYNSHYLIKVNPDSGARIKHGIYGNEPIIVGFTDDDGNVIERLGRRHQINPYTTEQVQLVIHHAQELVQAGHILQLH
jgi:hypothetical protein